MKTLTALLLLISLVLPAGMVAQAAASPVPAVCYVTDETGSTCCGPAAAHCCCDASPTKPHVPAPTLPAPSSSSSTAKDVAASLPQLLVLAELPRLPNLSLPSAPFSDRAPFATAPPVRLCVLRCSLII